MSSEIGHSEDLYHSIDFLKRITTLERMANQNTYDEITQDFKYWDDAADELRESKEGTLLPLWEFQYLREKKKQVTAIAWNPANSDLFLVAYGSYQFVKQGPGIICCFSLKNPSYPEYCFGTPSGVMAIDVHPKRPYLVAAALYDGSCLVLDLSVPCTPSTNVVGYGNGNPTWNNPVNANSGGLVNLGTGSITFTGTSSTGAVRYRSKLKHQHTDSVWQVAWQPDDLDGNPNFCSISSDGSVKVAVLVKNELMMSTVIDLQPQPQDLTSLALSGLCFDFHKTNDHVFVVGTEEGHLYKCSKEYNSQYLQQFEVRH
jgi:dynein intermediate chain 1